MKILVCGDTHCDTSAICNVAIPKARKNDCDLIVQVGDFGYWEHQESGKRFLQKVSKCLVREGMTMLWIDGNHENHPLLWSTYPVGEDGLAEIRPNLFYVPRGTVYNLGEVRCLFVGGAYSIDKDWRITDELVSGKPGTLWWPTEMLTHSDVERSIRHAEQDGPIDLMFTHDVPTGLNVPGVHTSQKERFPESTRNRMMLREIFEAVQPKMLVHGHYHTRYTGKLPLRPTPVPPEGFVCSTNDDPRNHGFLNWDFCRVDGLACNGMHGFAVILDLDSLFVSE